MEKHGVDFDTAVKVFFDPNRIEYYDKSHSTDEDRFITIGFAGKILFVVYTERKENVRLISARLATNSERKNTMIVRCSIDEIEPELTKEQIEQLERAERMPVIIDEDCPEFTDEMAKESYRPGSKIPMNVEPLTLFLSHETVDKARVFGDDYVSILSQMLDEAVNRRVAL